MDHFVKPIDSLSRLINEKAEALYGLLGALPLDQLHLPEASMKYLKSHHQQRNFFSVQTAAELLYRSISRKGKAVEDTIIMDYGAGVGSLYILAKMIGCKMVIYNDILEDMTLAAKIVAEYMKVPIDIYITADHTGTIQQLKEKGISCDIIVSRNVVEHIYDLNGFYGEMSEGQPGALIYFSTTANYQNPAMLWYHKRVHRSTEAEYLKMRTGIIQRKLPGIQAADLERLGKATRGLAVQDLDNAIEAFHSKGILPDPAVHHTNTCNPENGVWAEHIITEKEYELIITSKGYKFTMLPAFWDTHYPNPLKSVVGKAMNAISNMLGPKGGLKTTAFIYVIAEK